MALDDAIRLGIERLVAGQHHDPHSVLGAHAEATGAANGGGVIIRGYRPEAVSMFVLAGDQRVRMPRMHGAGVFEVRILGAEVPDYRLEVHYADGLVVTIDDPYRFWPTLGPLDLHLYGEGRHESLWRHLGAHVRTHQGVAGASFAVWAPDARSVRVVGDFNNWDGRIHPMRVLGSSGVWELFLPGLGDGTRYKYEILTAAGHLSLRVDPFAFQTEVPPANASVVHRSTHIWDDAAWFTRRAACNYHEAPVSIYECHLGSWKHVEDGGRWRPMTYRELADDLPVYLANMGFTHVQFLPVTEHPFDGSWGYQVTGYYAPTARFGSPDDFRYLVARLHQHGIGVLIDWVVAHFSKDDWALACFDGTALYEHTDPRQGEHPEWSTLIFNYGRHEVRNFLMANALFWVEEYHVDGLRVDAVASMLYLDYARRPGEWVPNVYGGNENLEAIAFLRETNEVLHRHHPGIMLAAEESTAWPAVSRPTYLGGLGFDFKWNMGWMNDTVAYFSRDPVHRRWHHHELTFALLYAFHENFLLPLSHDEVSHGKRSLLSKMPGDRWQQFADLRALYGWMWAHPGRQVLFMGGEIAQNDEWGYERSLDWHLLGYPEHAGVQLLIRTLNRRYRDEPALWERDFDWTGFRWLDADDADHSILSFLRMSADGSRALACVANLTPVVRHGYRVGLPRGGPWTEILNTDLSEFGGSGVYNADVHADEVPWQQMTHSAVVTLPPLAIIWLVPRQHDEPLVPRPGPDTGPRPLAA